MRFRGRWSASVLAFWQLTAPAPTPAELGIRPDCSETPVAYSTLSKAAERATGFLDFLKQIPEGTLQTFTLVRKTNSLQHHHTSPKWPRVLRMSADGKLVLSYVCEPESQDYGKIEVLRFDDQTRSFQASSWNFRKEPEYRGLVLSKFVPRMAPQRVEENPRVCASCHGNPGAANPDLRPIIANYPIWGGHYGSIDDGLLVGSEEERDFLEFRSRIFAEKIECYTSLPWPKKFEGKYEYYPYHRIRKNEYGEFDYEKPFNYHIRPNLKFNDALGHLMAQRLARKLEQRPEYQRVKYLLAAEAASCTNFDVGAELEARGFPKAVSTAREEPFFVMHPLTIETHTRNLYVVSRALGIADQEWTLVFNRPNDPEFYTGIPSYERDVSIGELAQGELLRGIGREATEVWRLMELSRGVSKSFAPQDFSCVDDLGGQVRTKGDSEKALFCGLMLDLSRRGETGPAAPPLPALPQQAIASREQGRALTAALARRLTGRASPLRGEELVAKNCTSCHAGRALPEPYAFLSRGRGFAQEAARDPGFVFRALYYLDSGRMPKDAALERDEIEDIQAYVLQEAWRGLR